MTSIKGFNSSVLKSSLSPENFHLILFPTEECNFRCVYCYEDFEIGNMPSWLVDATKLFLKRKVEKLDVLTLSWFGGEPLVAKSIVLDLAQYAYDLCEQHNCYLIGEMTTNGFMLDVKTLTALVNLKQKNFQISIDGDQESHDKTRLTRNGRGSFERIWKRLLDAAATDLDFNITLRIHVTALNVESVIRFCHLFKTEIGQDPRFRLFFKAIEDLGGDNNQEALEEIGFGGSIRTVAANLQDEFAPREDQYNYICYAAKPNSIAIRANGHLNKCTVALNDDKNKVGVIKEDGTIELEHQKFSTWIEGFSTLDSWQMGCPLSYINTLKSDNEQSKFSKDIEITEVV